MSYFDIKIQVMNGEYIKIFKYAYRLEKYIVSISKEMRELRTQEDSFSDIISSLHAIIEEIKTERNQMIAFGLAMGEIIRAYETVENLLAHPSQEKFEDNTPMTMSDYMRFKFEDNDKEFKDKIIDNELDKLDNLGLTIEGFKYISRQFGLQMEAETYIQMNKQGITNFTTDELQIGEMNNVAGRMALGATAGEIAVGSIAKLISSGIKVKNVGAEESILAKEVGKVDELNIHEFTAPASGKKIVAYVKDGVAVPKDKVEVFMRGKVTDVSEEFKELKALKQRSRKIFDADPNNALRLEKLAKMKKNYDRSIALRDNLESIGLGDTYEYNKMIFENLLDTGKKVTDGNTLWVESILEGPKGKLKLESTWKQDVDGYVYLSTIKAKPIH